MYIHDFDPYLINFGFIIIRWYSLAYIVGILGGWWLGKKIILRRGKYLKFNFSIKEFDSLISWIMISMILGGRFGYIIFYNFEYYLNNPIDMFKIWEGGMSFHGALIGIILMTFFFSAKKNISSFFLLDIISCAAPIGLFFGRIANFINAELYGKTSNVFWAVIFPNTNGIPRHPSQLYEAFLEGLVLFVILNLIIMKKNYKTGLCSFLFLVLYGLFRIIAGQFREPDAQIGYLFFQISTGTFLSAIMIFVGIIFLLKNNNNES